MSSVSAILHITQQIQQDLDKFDCNKKTFVNYVIPSNLYDEIITNKSLRKKTEKLFKDGHHARSVEEAYKLLDNIVKKKANLQNTNLTGASLMQRAFSPNNPILKLNSGITTSEQDEQSGYMQVFAGCMIGIRNPRAHETDWEDTEERALQLLSFANYLIERTELSEVQKTSVQHKVV